MTVRRVALMLVLLVGVGLLAGACAGKSRRAPAQPVVRLLVLDGVHADEAAETRRSEVGWWLSHRDRYESGNSGIILGEALAMAFARQPEVEVYSRTDLAAYMARKERLLERAYPGLSPVERLRVLQDQDPLDYGRSLNVDYVLATRVTHARTVHNRVFQTWMSEVRFEVRLWDVEEGGLVWYSNRRQRGRFASHLTVVESAAARVARDARRLDVMRLGRASAPGALAQTRMAPGESDSPPDSSANGNQTSR